MKDLIQRIVDWDSINKEIAADKKCNYEIGKAVLVQEEGLLRLPMTMNFVLPFLDKERLEALIINKIAVVDKVEFEFDFSDMIMEERAIIRNYIPYMAKILNGGFAAFTNAMDMENISFEGDSVIIGAFGKLATEQLNKFVKKEFERILMDTFGIETDIVFVNDDEIYQEKEKLFIDCEREEIEGSVREYAEELKARAAAQEAGGTQEEGRGSFNQPKGDFPQKGQWKRRQKELPAEGNRIMGKPIKGNKTAELSHISPELGNVIVEGILFRITKRKLKSGSYLATLLITDKKTTICTKAFVTESKMNELEEHLKVGDGVKIQGEVQFDRFENMNTVEMKSVEKLDSMGHDNMDNCAFGKRVELHIHTKMSSMDGLNEAADVVKQAALWGQPAIAITDHGVVQAFPDAAEEAAKQTKAGRPIKLIYGLEGYVFDDRESRREDGTIEYKKKHINHIIILAKDQEGLKNIYKLVSYSHLNYFYHRPRIPWSMLEAHREGLIIGAACEAGEVYQSFIKYTWSNKQGHHVKEAESPERQEEIASRYDYLEIQPVINNRFMFEKDYYFNGEKIKNDDDLRRVNLAICRLGEKLGKPVIATTDAHYGSADDAIYRNIIMAGLGFGDQESNGQGLYMRTTEEMLEEFSYLGKEKAIEVVIKNSNMVADMVSGEVSPVPKGKFPPKIEGDKETLRESCMKKAHEMYGDPLPDRIGERLEKELSSIIDNGYAVMYVSAQMLVNKSLEDGYLVGSRGSVGSSFAATMAGITEVNPLEPHYICPECKEIIWGNMNEFDCGIDMPPMDCPKCGTPMKRDGFTIPFATFLGFDGDKEPDIDLNFAGEYQATAHKYVGEIFGEKNVYKAGTVGSVADKTAYGYVMKYFEEREIPINKYEADRLAQGCTGVKKTTGQHPGGIVIVPDDHEIFEFCPIQHPANDSSSDIITTHFDYHKIDKNLLKLDVLGHDVPQMLRQLQDLTGVNPLTIDLTDRKVLSIFNGIEALDIKDREYTQTHGTFAIPEFGTPFTRQMLDDIHPDKFADLVRISGFSHGTDVWLNNAQDYIKSGTATMREVISTRDDIMNYLMLKGIENKTAFTIMEIVRKNKPLTEEHRNLMKDHGVPDWYIDSCIKIQYMFPRAHAVAYVMMSFRMAWFKVYYPVEFYATYFTTKAANFDAETILAGKRAILDKMDRIAAKSTNATAKEKDEYTVLEVAYEMYARGFDFIPANLKTSLAKKFNVLDGKVQLPFLAIEGVGETVAIALYEENQKKPYETIEEAVIRARLNKSVVEAMKNHGIFAGMAETDQLSMF